MKTESYLDQIADRMFRSMHDSTRAMFGAPPCTDEEWAEWNKPENVEARRIEQEKRDAEIEADRIANPDKYTCPHCGRDYDS